jgi:23S rRNA (guanosine2251-2'-O)-methyltransferase
MNKKLRMWELNRLTAQAFAVVEKIPLVLILDDIRSFENVGSFFRTADSFCIEKIILCGITPCPPHKEIHKTALGSTETVVWHYSEEVENAVENYRLQGYRIGVVEQAEHTTPLHKIEVSQGAKMALVFGNEVHGVKQTLVNQSDFVIEIPQFGTKHSLNVSVCAGIVLWEFSKALHPRLRA